MRDQAADLLSSQYGEAKREYRAEGKKVDVYFEHRELGRTTKIFLEAKDYDSPLKRTDVVRIRADYEGILRKNAPSILLIITRAGLTADAQSYVEVESEYTRHQTIWQIETGLIDLETYLHHLIKAYNYSDLSKYYVENGFIIREPLAKEHEAHVVRTQKFFDQNTSCFEALAEWCSLDHQNTPVAILGGYGTGKTSLAIRLASHLSKLALHDPHARQPIVIKLGEISQYANIEGLLGGFFTKTFPIRNFNFHNFLTLNEKGRFVIILDGFDEMKHSMNWSDFKAQVKNLLILHNGNSKIILLGRPSAFLSEIEERYILKGERPVGESWVTLPDWPRFYELEIKDFTETERKQFITRYLSAMSGGHDPLATKQRAELTNEIAGEDPDLYKKPVHSKILTDLASDPHFDLSQFRSASSRWLLYQEFMSSLYEREAEKRARGDISTERRIAFLGDLAFWLWTDRNASISFRANEIPRELYANIAVDDSDDLLPLCRELLVGSILERKSGDTFFFGHRSFAEFIVADSLLKRNPEAKDHESYSDVFRDGVREFLADSGRTAEVLQWSRTFGAASGGISQAYIDFLAEPHGGIRKLIETFPTSSVWRPILEPFVRSLIPNRSNYNSVFEALYKANSLSFAWHYCWLAQLNDISWQKAIGGRGVGSSVFDTRVITCLINALFSKLQNVNKNLFVSPEHAGLRRICSEAVKMYEFEGRAEFEWSHVKLSTACLNELKRNGIHWDSELSTNDRSVVTTTNEIYSRLNRSSQDNILIYIREVRSWNSITERDEISNRRREVARSSRPNRQKPFKAPTKPKRR